MRLITSRPLLPLDFTDESDRAEFWSYFAANREAAQEIRELHDAMLRIAAAKNPHQGARAVAQRGRKGWSPQYLRRLFDEWNAAGRDWRWLLDLAKFPNAREPKYPAETEAWLRTMLLKNKRVISEGIRAIHAQWRSWWRTRDDRFAIPGLVDAEENPKCPAPDGKGVPRLLEEYNLRRIPLDPAVVKIIREGTHAARALLPRIPGTREGVRPLEHVSADDMEGDAAVLCMGYGAVKPLQFGFWDYACSYYFPEAVGIRPRLPADDERATPGGRPKWEKLKRRDFLFNVAIFLETYGWPADWPMHLLLENGTATASRAEAVFLENVSEGLIKVGYSSMDGEFVMAYEEKKCGRSTAKAGHEGYHRILKDSLAHLPGFTGKDRDHTPAMLHGQVRAAEALENAVLQIPKEHRHGRELAAAVQYPILTLDQYIAETRAAIARIHARPDHDCELFADVMCWRPRGFHVEPALPELLPAFLDAHRIAPDDVKRINQFVEFLPRKETREERWRRLTAGVKFIRPPAGALVPLYEDNFIIRPIGTDYAIEFKHEGRKMRFFPPTPDHRLPAGEKVCGFWRPDGEVIHLFSGADGKNRRHLVTWPSEGRLMRSASAAEKAEFFGRQQKFFKAARVEADVATSEQIAAARAEHAQNEALLAEAGVLAMQDEPDAPTATTRAVQAVNAARMEHSQSVKAVRRVDVVKETLKRKPRVASTAGDEFA